MNQKAQAAFKVHMQGQTRNQQYWEEQEILDEQQAFFAGFCAGIDAAWSAMPSQGHSKGWNACLSAADENFAKLKASE